MRGIWRVTESVADSRAHQATQEMKLLRVVWRMIDHMILHLVDFLEQILKGERSDFYCFILFNLIFSKIIKLFSTKLITDGIYLLNFVLAVISAQSKRWNDYPGCCSIYHNGKKWCNGNQDWSVIPFKVG